MFDLVYKNARAAAARLAVALVLFGGLPLVGEALLAGGGNVAHAQAPAQAINVSVAFHNPETFLIEATITWDTDGGAVTGWDIEARRGLCSAEDCSASSLIVSLGNFNPNNTRRYQTIPVFKRGPVDYTFRIRARNGGEVGSWNNANVGTVFSSPTLVMGQAVSVSLIYENTLGRWINATLTWEKTEGFVSGWEGVVWRCVDEACNDRRHVASFTDHAPQARMRPLPALPRVDRYTYYVRSFLDDVGEGTDFIGFISFPKAPEEPVIQTVTRVAGAMPDAVVGSVSIAWMPKPMSTVSITAYILRYTDIENAATADFANWAAATVDQSVRFTVINGLSVGRAYRFSLQAVNENGGSPWAGAVNATLPGRPNITQITPIVGEPNAEIGSLTITWTPPADNGNASITAYVLRYISSGTAPFLLFERWPFISFAGSVTSAVIPNLLVTTIYRFSLQAVNQIGGGAWAGEQNILLPNKPIIQTVTRVAGAPNAVVGSLSIAWSPPPNATISITAYVLRYIDDEESDSVAFANWAAATVDESVTSTVINGLSVGHVYRFSLQAINAGGGSDWDGAVNATLPGKPNITEVTQVDGGTNTVTGSLTITWQPPVDDGNIAITAYTLRYIDAENAASVAFANWALTSFAGSVRSAVIDGLFVGHVYRFSLQAVNRVGGGAWASGQNEKGKPKVDKAILPRVAAILSRQWLKAINERLLQVGGHEGGGLQANALGASFGKGQMERGIAEALRKHGGALANGEKLDKFALRNMSFSYGGGGGMGAGGGLLRGGGVWGGASYTNMEDDEGEVLWDGENFSYYAGADRALDADRRWLGGLMLSYNRFEADFAIEDEDRRGDYKLRATGAHPYLLWRSADNAGRFWATFGYGAGDVEVLEDGSSLKRDAKVYSAAGGFRRNLWSNAKGAELDGQVDYAIARIKVERSNSSDVDATDADAKNFRALLEASDRVKMPNGGEASPFARAGFRYQSDDFDSAGGLELAVGWRWRAAGGWSGEVSGGAARLSGGYKEWHADAVLRKDNAGGKGLWLALRPQYGAGGGNNPVAATGDFWRAMTPASGDKAGERAGSLGLDVGYGLFGASALWRPFVGATVGESAGEYRAGAKWEQRLRADMGMSAGVFAKRKAAADQMQINFAIAY